MNICCIIRIYQIPAEKATAYFMGGRHLKKQDHTESAGEI